MLLTMTVLRCPGQIEPETRTVDGGEFGVGRGPDVDWVLSDPDQLLSRRHFFVVLRDSTWWIVDISANGTFLNGEAHPIGDQVPRSLQAGDRLRLGTYEIEVRLSDQAAQDGGVGESRLNHAVADDPFADDQLLPDAMHWLGPERSDHSSETSDPIKLPSAESVLPDDWDALLDGIGPAQPIQREQEAAAAPALQAPSANREASVVSIQGPATTRPIGVGTILWSLPNRMKVGRRERVEVRVGDAKVAVELLYSGLRGKGIPQIELLEVAPLMRVTLIADIADFSILPLSSADQHLRPTQIARWDFDATPLRAGRRLLRILASVRIKIEGKDEIMDLPSFEREVEVAVAPLRTTGHFCAKNWQWIAGSVVIPMFVWAAVASGLVEFGSSHLHRLLK